MCVSELICYYRKGKTHKTEDTTMKNIFEEIYQQEAELKKQYDTADDAGKDSIRMPQDTCRL